MIQAVTDKIIVEVLKATTTTSGLILPNGGVEPQAYGRVFSCGEKVDNVRVGDYIVFHPAAGMAMLIKKQVFKVLVYGEIYGKLEDREIIDTLTEVKIGAPSESNIIQPFKKG